MPHIRRRFAGLILLFFLCLFLAFISGRYPVRPADIVKILGSKIIPITPAWAAAEETAIIQIRLPRVLAAVVIGGGLSCAGAAYQGIFQNPMVSPDILGASAGSALGAALGILLSLPYQAVSLLSFLSGLLSVGLVCLVSVYVKNNPTLGLVLSGMMIGSICSAALSFIKLLADTNNVLPVITYWLMGSLASSRISDILFILPWMAGGMAVLLLQRWNMNVMTLGSEEAQCMGVHSARTRLCVIAAATLITSSAVSTSGMIGWIGLIIPHLSRMLVGSDYRHLLPASILMGSSFLLAVDILSRTLSTSEIPLGILTAFVGAPFFLWLIIRQGSHI